MAEQTIDIPGVGLVSFPAEMSDADISTAAGRLHGDAQAAAAQQRLTAEPEGSGLERAVKGFARTNPLTGLYNLLTTNPLTTLKGIGQSHLDEGGKTIDALKRLIVDHDPLALSEAVGHGVATLTPLVGPAAAHAGELIGSGDIAGGLGETGGLLMGVPSVGGRVVQGAGRAASKLAPLVKTPSGFGGAAGILHGNPLAATAAFAAPAVLEYGGRALERVGAGIRESAPGPSLSLRRLLGEEPVAPAPPPGESFEGYPRVTPTEAPVAPTPVPQPGESIEGFPRVTQTEAPRAPTPVPQPGESLEGYPRGTVTPAPSIVETLTQRSGAPRAVGRPLTMTENLQTRVAAPEPTGDVVTPDLVDEGWITPGETLQSLGIDQSPTAGRGFWKGLRRGDLWPQLQEEMLSSAEAPAPPSAAPTRPGRTGPGAQGKGGRFAPKETAAPTVAPASAPPVETPPPATTPAQAELVNDVRTTALKGRKAPAAQKAPANPDWPWKLDEATGEWIETRPPVTTSARPTRARRAPTSAAKVRAETTRPPAPTTAESSSLEPPPPTQQEYIAQATRAFQQAKLPVPPEVASGARMISHAEMDELAMELGDKKAHLIPYDWK